MANAFRKAANFLGLVDDEEIDQSTPVANQGESRLVDLCEVRHRPKLRAQHIFEAHQLAPQLQLLNQM